MWNTIATRVDNISQGLPWRTCLNTNRVEQKPSSAHASSIWDLKHPSDRITYEAKKTFTLCCSQQCCTSLPQDHLTWGQPSKTTAHPGKRDSLTEQAKRLSWSSAKGRGDYTSLYLSWGRNLVKHTTLKRSYSLFCPQNIYWDIAGAKCISWTQHVFLWNQIPLFMYMPWREEQWWGGEHALKDERRQTEYQRKK